MMGLNQTNTTNPLQIKKIARRQIGLVVDRDHSGQAISFAVNALELGDHNLPGQGRIKLFVYSTAREQSVDLGTVAAPHFGVSHRFTVKTSSPFHFRLIVCDADSPRIVASCEGLRATEGTDEAGQEHLLPVEPSDNLEEKLWELRIDGDGEPVLYVNNDEEVGMLARLRGDPVFQALILPQAFEQVLLHLVPHLEDEEGWHGKWNAYLSARNIDGPDDSDDEEGCAAWARAQAQAFANEHKFLTLVRTCIQEGRHDH